MVRSLAAWLWLIEFKNGPLSRALDASDDGSGDLSASLATHFDEVHALRASADALETLRASNAKAGWDCASLAVGSAGATPWDPQTFDCVAIHDAFVRRGLSPSDLRGELAGFHRLLRPGGWLCVASPHPPRRGRRNGAEVGVPRRRFSSALRAAGFAEVRCLFTAPTLERPLTLIPNVRRSILAYEASDAMRGEVRWDRLAAAAVGVRAMLYPAYFLLARA